MNILKIQESAVSHNVHMIHARTDKRIIAVVKNNGYGLGLDNAYHILKKCGIDFFAAADTEEVLQLRKLGCTDDILLLSPELSIETCTELLKHNIIFMLGSREQADILKAASLRCKMVPRIHLEIDTGLGRYGFPWDGLNGMRFYTNGMKIEGCYTHFATAGAFCSKSIHTQFAHFQDALSELAFMGLSYGMTHASASKAFLLEGDMGCDAIRVGSLLLGCCSGPESSDYQRAVYLQSNIYMKNIHKKGDNVGYDGKLRLRRDTEVGLVKAGYADGILVGRKDLGQPAFRLLIKSLLKTAIRSTPQTYAAVDGQSVQILGKIGMNHLLLDLSSGNYSIGDEVTVPVNPLFVPKELPREVVQL